MEERATLGRERMYKQGIIASCKKKEVRVRNGATFRIVKGFPAFKGYSCRIYNRSKLILILFKNIPGRDLKPPEVQYLFKDL